jgi:hypothetical protein
MPPVSKQHGLQRPRAPKRAIQRHKGAFSKRLHLIENKWMAMDESAIFITGQ